MDINTILETFKDALSQNSALSTWANTNYGQTHKVYLNIDMHNPPGEDDCPYLVLYPDSKSVGAATARKRHSFIVIACIHDVTLVTNPEDNVVEYTGVKNLETFRKLAEDAIAGASISNAVIDTLDIDYEIIDSFPFMLTATNISVGESHLIGADPLE